MLHTYHTDYACLDMWQQWPHFDNVLIIYTNFVSFWCCTFSGNHYGTLIITFGLIVLKQYYCIHHIFLFDECSTCIIYNYITFVSIEHTCILLEECSIVSLLHFFVLNTHDHSNSKYMYPPHCHPSLGSSSDRQTSRPRSGCRLSWQCRCFWRHGRQTGTIAPAVSSCPVGSSCLQFYIKTTNITSLTETLKYSVFFIHNSTQHLIFYPFSVLCQWDRGNYVYFLSRFVSNSVPNLCSRFFLLSFGKLNFNFLCNFIANIINKY